MSILADIREKISKYAEIYLNLLKLSLIEHSANLMSYFIFLIISLLILFCILLFTGFGIVEVFIAIGLTKLAAFFVTVGIYLVFLLVIIFCRKGITRYFSGRIIQVLTEEHDDDEN